MDQLLKIAGTVAAVQLLFVPWREWRSARRVVGVGGLDAEVYAEHGCVPLQFAGSRYTAVRAVVAVTWFFMVRLVSGGREPPLYRSLRTVRDSLWSYGSRSSALG